MDAESTERKRIGRKGSQATMDCENTRPVRCEVSSPEGFQDATKWVNNGTPSHPAHAAPRSRPLWGSNTVGMASPTVGRGQVIVPGVAVGAVRPLDGDRRCDGVWRGILRALRLPGNPTWERGKLVYDSCVGWCERGKHGSVPVGGESVFSMRVLIPTFLL